MALLILIKIKISIKKKMLNVKSPGFQATFYIIYYLAATAVEEILSLLTLKQSPRQFHVGVVMNQHKERVWILFHFSHKNFKLGLDFVVQTNNVFFCSLISCSVFLQTQVYKDTCQAESKSFSFYNTQMKGIHTYSLSTDMQDTNGGRD